MSSAWGFSSNSGTGENKQSEKASIRVLHNDNSDEKVPTAAVATKSKGENIGISQTKQWRRCAIYTIIIIYGVIPAIALLFPSIVAVIAFSYSLPFYFGDLKDPSSAGLEAARHIDLVTPSGDTLGVWHILPESALEEKEPLSKADFDSRLAVGDPIFIYAHGSGGTRGQFNRLYTYTALRGQGWHVIAFDYRGFADSTGETSESNMVEDAMTVYRWVKKQAGSSPVFLWGHSLGSGVVTEAGRHLSTQNQVPDGIVLEGAFNNLEDLVDIALITLPYRPFPFLLRVFQNALKHESVLFKSDEHLAHVQCPTLMLHAEDDRIVPIDLCRKLFQSTMSAERKDQPSVTLHVFPESKGYGHNRVSLAPDLGYVVRHFVQESQKHKARS